MTRRQPRHHVRLAATSLFFSGIIILCPHMFVRHLFGGQLVTVETLNTAIAKGLTEEPSLTDVSSVQVAPLVTRNPDAGTLVVIRTVPRLSGIIARCQPHQYARRMSLNIARCFATIADYFGDGDVLPMPNELVALVISDMWQMERRGFVMGPSDDLITGPQVPIGELRATSDPARREELVGQLSEWGRLLISLPWLGMNVQRGKRPTGIDFLHLPDLPLDDLAHTHFEHTVRMGAGWNFAETISPAALHGRVAEVRRAMTLAQTVATY